MTEVLCELCECGARHRHVYLSYRDDMIGPIFSRNKARICLGPFVARGILTREEADAILGFPAIAKLPEEISEKLAKAIEDEAVRSAARRRENKKEQTVVLQAVAEASSNGDEEVVSAALDKLDELFGAHLSALRSGKYCPLLRMVVSSKREDPLSEEVMLALFPHLVAVPF